MIMMVRTDDRGGRIGNKRRLHPSMVGAIDIAMLRARVSEFSQQPGDAALVEPHVARAVVGQRAVAERVIDNPTAGMVVADGRPGRVANAVVRNDYHDFLSGSETSRSSPS